MDAISRAHVNYGNSLILRGTFLLVLGLTAIGWPRETLLPSMLAATLAFALFGVYEMILGMRARTLSPGWPLPVATGIVCVTFALLSLLVLEVSLRFALAWVSVWLLGSASLTFLLAFALWPMRWTRVALLAWTACNVVLAALAGFYPEATIITLLHVGACYAVGNGMLHVASGLWIKTEAVSRVGPTLQSTWAPLHGGTS